MNEFIFTKGLRERAFKHFEGMDEKYEETIRDYHRVYLNDSFTKEHKLNSRGLVVDLVSGLKSERIEKFKEEIEKIRKEHMIKPEPKEDTAEEKTANLLLWNKIIPTSTIQELRELREESPTNEDLKRYIKAELRERSKGMTTEPSVTRLLNDLEHGTIDNRFTILDDLIKQANFIKSIDYYPAMIKDNFAEIQQRNIQYDLDRFPIDNFTRSRPEFRISITNNKVV